MRRIALDLLSIILVILFSCNSENTSTLNNSEALNQATLKVHSGTQLYPICVYDRWGYIDSFGKVVIKPIYEFADDFENGTGTLFIDRENLAIIDGGGNPITFTMITGSQHYYWDYNSEGLVLVYDKKTKKYGYVNLDGDWVIKPKFEGAHYFKNGLAAVAEKMNYHPDTNSDCGTPQPHAIWGFINSKGKYVIEPQYGTITDFYHGYSFVDHKIIDSVGNYVDEADVKDVRFLYYKFQFVHKLLYPKGRDITSNSENFINGYIVFKDIKTKKYGYLNWKGEIIIKPQFNNPTCFSEDLAGVSFDNNKWGVIDTNGNIIVPPTYDFVMRYSEGLASVKLDGKWGFINKKGDLIIKPIFDEKKKGITSYKFHNGLACVYLHDKMCYINKLGDIIWKES